MVSLFSVSQSQTVVASIGKCYVIFHHGSFLICILWVRGFYGKHFALQNNCHVLWTWQAPRKFDLNCRSGLHWSDHLGFAEYDLAFDRCDESQTIFPYCNHCYLNEHPRYVDRYKTVIIETCVSSCAQNSTFSFAMFLNQWAFLFTFSLLFDDFFFIQTMKFCYNPIEISWRTFTVTRSLFKARQTKCLK